MKDKIKISIITTFYNAENTVLAAVKSVISNKLPQNLIGEYIIIDDCSLDNSYNVVKNFIEDKENNNPSIECKLIKTDKNLGCGGARKFGIENATGDYFMFLDADDYYLSDTFINRAYNDIVRTEADIVEYGIIENQLDGSRRKIFVDKEHILTDKNVIMETLLRDGIIRFYVWTKIYKKEIINSRPYSDSREFEDIRTIPYWVYNANKIAIMPSAEINYRASENSIIRNNALGTRIGTLKALLELMQNLPKEYAWHIYERALIDLIPTLDGHASTEKGFNECSLYNTEMLKILFPNDYVVMTYNVPEETTTTNKLEDQH